MNAYRRLSGVLALAAVAALGTATWAHADSCCASPAAAGTQAVAQNQPSGHEGHAHGGQPTADAQKAEKAAPADVTVTGTNYCVSCSVTNKESAMAECERSGHKMAVKVKEAKDADGNLVPELKGRVLRYAANENAKTLADRARWGEQVTLEGTLSKSGRQLTVGTIAAEETALALPTATQADADRYMATLAEGDRYYTCTMHPEVVSDKPGECPKCNMKLVERIKAPSDKAKTGGTPAPSESGAAGQQAPASGHDHAGHQH